MGVLSKYFVLRLNKVDDEYIIVERPSNWLVVRFFFTTHPSHFFHIYNKKIKAFIIRGHHLCRLFSSKSPLDSRLIIVLWLKKKSSDHHLFYLCFYDDELLIIAYILHYICGLP
jgi:hypothetical protein